MHTTPLIMHTTPPKMCACVHITVTTEANWHGILADAERFDGRHSHFTALEIKPLIHTYMHTYIG